MTYRNEIIRNGSADINSPYGKHATTIHTVHIGMYWYYVHCTKVPEGYIGQVIHDGEFFCLVPLSRSTVELLNNAEAQIRRVRETNRNQ